MFFPPYSIAPVDFSQVIDSIRMPQSRQMAPLVLAISPCRSGSTVLLRVFGASGTPAYFQPLKNSLRWAMQGQPWQWDFPVGNVPVFIKETLGPYTLLEANFNPFDVLQALKYPLENLRILFIGRDPLDTWGSWHQNWGQKTNVEILIAAYKQTESIRQQVKAIGLPAVHFVYEAVRDFGAETAIRGLFEQLNFPFSSIAISGWKNLPAYGAPGSNIYCDLEPEPFVVPNIHERVEQADSLTYYPVSNPLENCKPEDIEQIRANQLSELYAVWQDLSYSYLAK